MIKRCFQCGKSHPGAYPHAKNDLLAKIYKMDLGIKPEFAKILRSPKFLEWATKPFHIDKTYDVPLVAGNSTDFKTMYIDKHLDLTDEGDDITPYLAMHERTEWPLMHIFGLKYTEAHPIAEKVEEMGVRLDGVIPLKEYNAHYTKSIRTDAKEKMDLPPALDPKPYRNEKMTSVVNALLAAQ